MTKFVLVSQGCKLFETDNFLEAFEFYKNSNEEWAEYCRRCAEEYEPCADNEVFMYEETDGKDVRELSFEEIMKIKEQYI